jgi:hypothetical protein
VQFFCPHGQPDVEDSISRPTLQSFTRIQQSQRASSQDIAEFVAAPWLLPSRTSALPYWGKHQLDDLMAMRANDDLEYNRSLTILFFSRAYSALAQNASKMKFVHLMTAYSRRAESTLLTGCSLLDGEVWRYCQLHSRYLDGR